MVFPRGILGDIELCVVIEISSSTILFWLPSANFVLRYSDDRKGLVVEDGAMSNLIHLVFSMLFVFVKSYTNFGKVTILLDWKSCTQRNQLLPNFVGVFVT